MELALSLNRNRMIFGIPLTLLGLLILLIYFSPTPLNHCYGLALSLDLIFTVPLIYILLIWKTGVPKTTVVPVVVIGYLLGSYLVPVSNQGLLLLFKVWALPVIEGGVLLLVILKLRKAIREYRKLDKGELDFFNALWSVCAEVLPKPLVRPFATEVAVLYYGLLNWKKHMLADNEFSIHKKSGTPALLGAFIFIIAVETVILHLLIAMWSETVAWVLTGLSIYSVFQLLGFARSLAKRPITIKGDQLYLRYGIMSEANIPLASIKSIELSREKLDDNALTKKLSPLGTLESHNVIIRLKEEQVLIGLYGSTKAFTTLGLFVDDAENFVNTITSK